MKFKKSYLPLGLHSETYPYGQKTYGSAGKTRYGSKSLSKPSLTPSSKMIPTGQIEMENSK